MHKESVCVGTESPSGAAAAAAAGGDSPDKKDKKRSKEAGSDDESKDDSKRRKLAEGQHAAGNYSVANVFGDAAVNEGP